MELRVEYPALPLLVEGVHTFMASVLSKTRGSRLRVSKAGPLVDALEIGVGEFGRFKGSLMLALREAASVVSEVKVLPITARGTASELNNVFYRKLPGLFEKAGVEYPRRREGEKLYAWFPRVVKAYAELLGSLMHSLGDFAEIFGRGWEVEAVGGRAERLRLATPGGRVGIPAVVRTSSFYEQGRFFGLRDFKERGSVSQGAIEVKGDEHWFMLLLSSVCRTLAAQVQLARREFCQVYVGARLEYGREFDHTALSVLLGLVDAVRGYMRRLLFLEDLEVLRLVLTLKLYLESLRRGGFVRGASIAVNVVRPTGARFTGMASLDIPLDYLGVIDASMSARWGGAKLEAAEDLIRVGEMIIRIYKVPDISREVGGDRLLTAYKFLCYGALETGYKPPCEFLYEIVRTLEQEDVFWRYVNFTARRLVEEEGYDEKEAREKSVKTWRRFMQYAVRLCG